jgi:uncharacterized iron-regulated protein
MRVLLLTLLTLLGALGCQTAHTVGPAIPDLGRGHRLRGRIWSVAERRFISETALIERLRQHPLVLLGERHDNGEHHQVQARVLRGLVRAGRRPAVAWEMLTSAEEAALARHLQAHPRDAAGWGAAVRWNARGWPEWALYRPIAEVALEARLPMVAAGVDRQELMRMAHGAVSPGTRPVAEPCETLPPAALASLASSIRASHCGHASARMVQMMTRAQAHRDAFMARRLIAAGAHHGAVLIAGGEHARQDRGVPHYVRWFASHTVASVGLMEVVRGREDPASYAPAEAGLRPPFDFLWFTLRADNEDPCATFRMQLSRLRNERRPHPASPGPAPERR